MRIARVFPRWTTATPTDELSFWGKKEMPGLFLDDIDQVHISVTFTYDMQHAERLYEEWRHVAPIAMGGPAFGAKGGEFVPGRYLRPGYVITSRGCPNRCKVNGIEFCPVPRREGKLRELPVTEGNIIQDDNLLACSDGHIREVFAMLKRQKFGPVIFSGGLEAKRLKDWHIEELRKLHPHEMFFAYDEPDDYKPLVDAGRKLLAAGFTRASHTLRAYVLVGYPGDTMEKAEHRCIQAIKAGYIPFAMFYRDDEGRKERGWAKFQEFWARPASVNVKVRELAMAATHSSGVTATRYSGVRK